MESINVEMTSRFIVHVIRRVVALLGNVSERRLQLDNFAFFKQRGIIGYKLQHIQSNIIQ